MTYFNLFSNILVTKGFGRILISDLQRNVSELYPLELYEMIEDLKKYSIEDTMKMYDEESKKAIEGYLNILQEKEFGFITENKWDNSFPSLSYEYYEASRITELFVENPSISLLKKLRASVEDLRIKHLIIYSSKILTKEDFIDIDEVFRDSVLSGIEIFSPFHSEVDQIFVEILNENTKRIYNIIFFDCPPIPFTSKDEYRFTLQFVEEHLKISACGKVDLKYFNTNLPKVQEAISHNSCLHKKMGIDGHGNIKNCPLMSESYGNIYQGSLEEALQQPGFKKYWNITKDNIEGCKDCEFRYICTDCRAYTERSHYDNSGLDVSKPLKCGYNPYTNEWEDWSKNYLKQTAITFYNF